MDKKQTRQKEVRIRKNLPIVLAIIAFMWFGMLAYLYFVDPTATLAVVGFFTLTYVTLSFTIATLVGHTQRGFRIGAGLTAFLVLRYFGIGNLVNFFLLVGVMIAVECYFAQKV